jgi:hypothetical protein
VSDVDHQAGPGSHVPIDRSLLGEERRRRLVSCGIEHLFAS